MVQGLVTMAWMLLIWLLGLTISPNYKFELEQTTLVSVSVAVMTVAMLLAVRIISGKSLTRTDIVAPTAKRFQYSVTTLLSVMLLVGLTITAFGWVDIKYLDSAALSRAEAFWFYPVWRRAMTWNVATEAIACMLIAAACLPAFLGRRKRSFAWAIGLSVVVLISIVGKEVLIRHRELFPFVGTSHLPSTIQHFFLLHIANFTTLTTCLLTTAAAMHGLGYSLEAPARSTADE